MRSDARSLGLPARSLSMWLHGRRRRRRRARRYLFVRCDNAPAPWTSDEAGDALRLEVPQLAADEMSAAAGGKVHEMGPNPYW